MADSGGHTQFDKRAPSRVRILVFWIIFVVVLILDRVCKIAIESYGQFGLTNTYLGLDGLFRFTLVHNTGAAWGIFAGNSLILGVIALIVSALMMAYALIWGKDGNTLQIVGLALVSAGGIGNAIDRFVFGYVVDFINVTFIDFPVFNIADMGVTCGVIVFLAGLIVEWVSVGRYGGR